MRKPFAMNARQAELMNEPGERKGGVFNGSFVDKVSSAFLKMQEMIGQGLLGDIRSVLINFGFKPTPPIPARLFDPELGGGTVMDIGIYNVFMAMSILGMPDQIDAVMTPASNRR